MKISLTKISLLSITLLMSLALVGCGKQQSQNSSNTYTPSEKEIEKFEEHAEEEHGEGHVYVNAEQLSEYASGELSEQEIADIIHMRQEEKLARDVYRTLGETYAINQFKNIPMSEQKHTDAMELLLERYDIEDPIEDETIIGTYKDEKFVTLYKELTEKGEQSLINALVVGATIEDLNMAKLLEVIENTNNDDIQFVYESVLEQSHHHMNTFIRGLDQQGETYTPEYITQEYFDNVLLGNS